MRRNSFVLGLVLAACFAGIAAGPAAAVEPSSGIWELGVILGEPTGLSAKYWTSRDNAVDFGAAWSFEGDGQFHFHCDYLFHNYEFFKVDQGSFPIYFGIGGRLRLDEDNHEDNDGVRIGLRLVLGAEYLTDAYPMSVFFEIAPIIDFAPETEADINGGLGIRYVF